MVSSPTRGRNSGTRKQGRTPASCDRCKSRKTKCINPVPGPCQFCRSIGATCEIGAPRKQRPFYHVSEAEYRLAMQLLQKLLPDKQLNVETMLPLVQSQSPVADLVAASPTSIAAEGSNGSNSTVLTTAHSANLDPQGNQSDVEDIRMLHEQIGCLMVDAMGKQRYVGADSSFSFSTAVRSLRPNSGAQPATNRINPKISSISPEFSNSPESRILDRGYGVYLPPRVECDAFVARFFEEVNGFYWLYPAEQFHTLLEETYASNGVHASDSWLCALYAICALGSHAGNDDGGGQGDVGASSGKVSEYLSMAKNLVSHVIDVADLDSVRSLTVLCIVLQSTCSTTTAYLYIGIAVKIAFTLGLQFEKNTAAMCAVDCEQARRIFWTIYVLDQELAGRCGNAPTIFQERLYKTPPLPSELILNPGIHTPLGYLPVLSTLFLLKKRIRPLLYNESDLGLRPVSLADVSQMLDSLRAWLASTPPHLKISSPTPRPHRRQICMLHLHYWNAVIMVTRPFLLYAAAVDGTKLSVEKKRTFDELSKICIVGAQSALEIVKTMAAEGVLSGVLAFDSNCILDLVQILVLAFKVTKAGVHQEAIRECMQILGSMRESGCARKVWLELSAQIDESGILDVDVGLSEHERDQTTEEEQDWTHFQGAGMLHSASSLPTLDYVDFFDAGAGDLCLAGVNMGETFQNEAMLQLFSDQSRWVAMQGLT